MTKSERVAATNPEWRGLATDTDRHTHTQRERERDTHVGLQHDTASSSCAVDTLAQTCRRGQKGFCYLPYPFTTTWTTATTATTATIATVVTIVTIVLWLIGDLRGVCMGYYYGHARGIIHGGIHSVTLAVGAELQTTSIGVDMVSEVPFRPNQGLGRFLSLSLSLSLSRSSYPTLPYPTLPYIILPPSLDPLNTTASQRIRNRISRPVQALDKDVQVGREKKTWDHHPPVTCQPSCTGCRRRRRQFIIHVFSMVIHIFHSMARAYPPIHSKVHSPRVTTTYILPLSSKMDASE
ncbi:hypothetical protein K504DRAFT_486809 [Pleomassaria siparia CBS 279.74]|uniref:Uncharacterized protein n=1 Tax=Pleomassaria siparia CBS 279.74 TaxID=1314801 RepID=A0A6G1KR59_9PLEO|nr:hypothetical protein K504DRAFT_486809 [Pleomassaria siparia CBS 279.74]